MLLTRLFLSVMKHLKVFTKIGNYKIWENNEDKLLGVTIDNKLKFDSHIANICFKANEKLIVVSRLASLLTFGQKQVLFNPIPDGIFWAAHGWEKGGAKKPHSLKSATHILQ